MLLQVGIQLSRNVLTVMSYTVRVWRCPGGERAGGSAFWRALRRCHHLFERATDCKQMTKKKICILKRDRLCESLPLVFLQQRNNSTCTPAGCRLRARIHPRRAAAEIYFRASTTTSTSTHTGSVAKVIGKSGQSDLFLNVARVGRRP